MRLNLGVAGNCFERRIAMLDPDKTLALAEQVSKMAVGLGIPTALIGAAALAVHGYARGTQDIDLAAAVPPDALRRLREAAQVAGLRAELRLPDEDDPLGGVLVVSASEDEDHNPTDVVEVVNFLNLLRPSANPAAEAIARSVRLEGLQLRCVAMADLVALKLYAGSRRDLADIVEVLAHNPDTDLVALRSIAGRFDRARPRQCIGAVADRRASACALRGRNATGCFRRLAETWRPTSGQTAQRAGARLHGGSPDAGLRGHPRRPSDCADPALADFRSGARRAG